MVARLRKMGSLWGGIVFGLKGMCLGLREASAKMIT